MRTITNVLTVFSVAALALTGDVFGARPSAAIQIAALEGVWRTAEVVVPGPAAASLRPTSSLAIFHGRHYSRVEVHTEQPRPPLTNPATASADELRAVWGPFVGEAGTFELTHNTITMQATVAKNPAAMTPGTVSTFTYRLDGNTLTLTQVRGPAGPVSNPATIRLIRVE